ncbi:MAG: hypothetical protein HY721_29745 [Planctomycetes bacterium]|nr:hypothetical protein [Planctomycetota bacterium]
MRPSPLLLAFAAALFPPPLAPALAAPPAAAPFAAAPPAAAVLLDELPGLDEGLAHELAGTAREAGYAVSFVGAEDLCSRGLDPASCDLLVLPAGRTLPVESAPRIQAFLEAGGDVLALGLPAWRSPAVRAGGRWVAWEEVERTIAAQRPARLIEDFEAGDLSRWRRNANDPSSSTERELAPAGGGRALHVTAERLTGWDTLSSPPLERPFAPGHTLTCFRAKGGPATRQLALEWTERGGSRWIAVVDLGTEWRWYALPPEAFVAWEPPPGRGGPGDGLRVEEAERFTAGLALTHTAVPQGRHEYWLDDIGTAPSPFAGARPPRPDALPHVEGLGPAYLFHPSRGAAALRAPPGLALLGPLSIEADGLQPGLEALHPRPRGVGFLQGRRFRWQPLLEARSAAGEHRGAAAALLVHAAKPFHGAVVASFTPAEPATYRAPAVHAALRGLLHRMRRGAYLLEGGAEHFTVFEGQALRVGATTANLGKEPAKGLSVRLAVADPSRGTKVFERTWTLDLAPGAEETVEATVTESGWPPEGLVVTVELREGGDVLDRLEHELGVWRPKARASFVEARDGGFRLGGKPWKAHGVNYMPSSGIALADGEAFERWLGRGPYDPEVIDRDLRRIAGLGMNAVSVFVYHRSIGSQNLLDLLRRCETLGLRVNQSLRPGTPMDFRWGEMRELIERYRLAENDTVFAYDLAWEPSHHGPAHQRSYAPAWRDWVAARRGGVEAAERAWGVPAPRDGGELGVPAARHLLEDGPWRKLAADYRAFLDELVGARYAEARRLVRTLDARHPVSFRMQFAGDPTHLAESLLPYDFPGLAGAVDIWEPEAYGRIGDWDRVRAGRFTADYARLSDPAKPVLWAEAGYDAWSRGEMAPDPERRDVAAAFYRDFYRMLRESGSDGVLFWWYPGGYRLNERSDYGIIEPDGTDRPVTRAIREEGPRFLQAPKPAPPDVWLEVDRDADARGLPGIYEAVKGAYWKAIEEGKRPGLRWARRPGAR